VTPQAGDALPRLDVKVTARTVIMGASASRDWQPQHHDHHWAVNRAGTRDIFLNTPNQAGWIERYLTDWTGPMGRLGKLRFRMRRPICTGDALAFEGVVRSVTTDDAGCTWADVDVSLVVGEERATECIARVALPKDENDNPWKRAGKAWTPDAPGPLELLKKRKD
jgi:acyl dehydratase